MHEVTTIFGELALLALLGVLVSLVLRRIRLPPVAGLLVVGAVAGPHGLELVGGHGRLEVLAEVGVVLLLFTIGLEFSIERLKAIARLVLLGGTLQVTLTTAAAAGLAYSLGMHPEASLPSLRCRARPSCFVRSESARKRMPRTAASSSAY